MDANVYLDDFLCGGAIDLIYLSFMELISLMIFHVKVAYQCAM